MNVGYIHMWYIANNCAREQDLITVFELDASWFQQDMCSFARFIRWSLLNRPHPQKEVQVYRCPVSRSIIRDHNVEAEFRVPKHEPGDHCLRQELDQQFVNSARP